MTPSSLIVAFIKGWESCRLTPYRDQAGKWTVGWGHLMHAKDNRTQTITQDEADALFDLELAATANAISDMLVPISQPQFDAVLSLAYNIGIDAFAHSTLRRMLDTDNYDGAADQFPRWCHITVNGTLQVSQGLLKRRQAERAIFVNGNYGGRP